MILVILLIAFVLVAWYAWRHPGTRQCRWRASLGAGKWYCTYCGAETGYDPDGPPRTCLRNTE